MYRNFVTPKEVYASNKDVAKIESYVTTIADRLQKVEYFVDNLIGTLDYQDYNKSCGKIEGLKSFMCYGLDQLDRRCKDLEETARKGGSRRLKVTVCAGKDKVVIKKNAPLN
jgi:hypothetical protein